MSVKLKGQVNSFLKRAFKCDFFSKLYAIQEVADDADMDLFRKTAKLMGHCVHSLLPPVKSCNHYLRPKGHIYEMSRCDSKINRKSFVPCCLFKYMWCVFFLFFTFLSCWLSAWYFMHCLFPLFTCTFVTCYIKYQSINQSWWQFFSSDQLPVETPTAPQSRGARTAPTMS